MGYANQVVWSFDVILQILLINYFKNIIELNYYIKYGDTIFLVARLFAYVCIYVPFGEKVL